MSINPNLSKALLKAQSTMGKLVKDAANKAFTGVKYATLAAVIDTVRQPLTDSGLVLYQSASTHTDENNKLGVMVRSMLIHGESGESIEEQLIMPVAQATPQGIGSAITYARRYLIMLQCGLAPDDEEDDDGNASSGKAVPQATNGKATTTTKQPAKTEQLKAEQPKTTTTTADPEKERKAFHAEGVTLFAAEWDQVRPLVVERYTGKQTPDNKRTSSNDLTAAELTELAKTFKTSAAGWRKWWDETKSHAADKQPVTA